LALNISETYKDIDKWQIALSTISMTILSTLNKMNGELWSTTKKL